MRTVLNLETYHQDGLAQYNLVLRDNVIEKCTYTVKYPSGYVHVDKNSDANLLALLKDVGNRLTCCSDSLLINAMKAIAHVQ